MADPLHARGGGWREVWKSINTTITKYCSLAPPWGTIEQYLSNIAPLGTFLSPGKNVPRLRSCIVPRLCPAGCARLDDCAPAPSSKAISHMIHYHFYLTSMIDMCFLWTGCYLMGGSGEVPGQRFKLPLPTGLKINIEAWDVMLPPTLLGN